MTEQQVQESLGLPIQSIWKSDFRWLTYENGMTVGMSGGGRKGGTVAWIVQAEGSIAAGVSIGDSEVSISKRLRFANPIVGPGGSPCLRLDTGKGLVLDVVIEAGRASAFALHPNTTSPDAEVPYPAPKLFPRFKLGGIALRMRASDVRMVLGPPQAVEKVGDWIRWRYPALGLVVDFVTGENGELLVGWAMQRKGSYIGNLRIGDSTVSWKPAFGSLGSGTTLWNDRGEAIRVRASSGVIASLELETVPPLAGWPVDTGSVALSCPLKLAGVALLMPDQDVRSVLGNPDLVTEAGSACYWWEYLERGLVIFLGSPDPGHAPPVVGSIEQSRGSWNGLAVGTPQDEAERRLGRTAAEHEGVSAVKVEGQGGRLFDVRFADGWVSSFVLSVAEGY